MYAEICLLLSPILITRLLFGVSGRVFAPSSITAHRSKGCNQHNAKIDSEEAPLNRIGASLVGLAAAIRLRVATS